MNSPSLMNEYRRAEEIYQSELLKLRALPKDADIDTELTPQLDMLATAHGRMERAKRRAFGQQPKYSKPKRD